MINLLAVDDDGIILEYVCDLVREGLHLEKKIVSYTSSTQFFQEMHSHKPDIVLLDIDMPDINGFELAELLRSVNPNITLIFISNLENMVFDSFALGAFYFVRKNCLEKDLKRALECYEEKVRVNEKQFHFRTTNVESSISLGDILYFESFGHEVTLHSVNQTMFTLKREKETRIKMIDEQLSVDGFIRVHKSYLVNYRYIHLINKTEVILKNGLSIQINPKKAADIRKEYQKFLMQGVN